MLTIADKEHVLTTLVTALSPYVGKTMAGASVRGMCQKLGLAGAHLDRDEVGRLVDALAPGLDVFVGREKGRAVVRAIWETLDAMEQAR